MLRTVFNLLMVSSLALACSIENVRAEKPDTKKIDEIESSKKIGAHYWHTDYVKAYRKAKRNQKQLLLFFRDEEQQHVADHFETRVLASDELAEPLSNFVRVVVSLETPVPFQKAKEETQRLIDHRAFRHMHGRQGIALLDLVDPEDSFYGTVTAAHPFSKGKHYTLESTHIVLNLPRATVTQRALVFVLETHPEAPRSTDGKPNRYLFKEARKHSHLMADLGQVGHQNWGTRFYTITDALDGAVGVAEVAAVGTGRTLIEAARDCVYAWRRSPGHWESVSRRPLMYGYDVIQAPSGDWYATGIFAYSE